MRFDRLPRASVAAAALLGLDAVIRLLAGGPYPGATSLLLAACGISLLPLIPAALGTPSLRLAVLPALGLGSFAILITTVSIVGIPLTELSIRLAVLGLVVVAAATARGLGRHEKTAWSARREGIAVAVLVGVFAFSLGSSWDIAGSFPPRGTDWGHYLLYADEVEAQDALLIDDPLAGEEDRVFADPAGVGALYGSFLILDGTSSRRLGSGVVLASALTPLSVYAAVGALWGIGAGLLAAAAYAVSPIRLEPMYWHGLATTLALVFLPLAVLALGLMYRGSRDRADDRASRVLARGGRRVAFHERRGRGPADRGRGDDRARPHAHHQTVVPSAIEQRDTAPGPARRCRRLRPRGRGGRAPEAAGGRAGLAGQLPPVRARLARMSRPSSTTTRGRSSRWLR